MPINIEDAFIGALLIQLGQNQLLYTKHDSIFAADANCCADERQKTIIINLINMYLYFQQTLNTKRIQKYIVGVIKINC